MNFLDWRNQQDIIFEPQKENDDSSTQKILKSRVQGEWNKDGNREGYRSKNTNTSQGWNGGEMYFAFPGVIKKLFVIRDFYHNGYGYKSEKK